MYEGMICDKFFRDIEVNSEEEATKIIIKRIKDMVNNLSDEELESEFGIIVWEV